MTELPEKKIPDTPPGSPPSAMVAQPTSGRVLFTVTSALNASPAHSRFDNRQRLQQTCETINSIRARIPDADIMIVDGSVEQPSGTAIAQLGANISFLWYGHLPELQHAARHPNFNVVKNISELTLYSRLIGDLLGRNGFLPYRRVFKLSGRYQLNAHFDPDLHLSAAAAGSFVFARRTAATWRVEHVGTTYAWQTRLFSYDPSLAHLLGSLYLVALRDMHLKLAVGMYTDIEHSIGRYLNPNLVLETEAIGVCGEIGSYAMRINE